MNCPMCGKTYLKALYIGFPLRICSDPLCGCAEGWPALWLMEHMPLLTPEENEQGGWALFVYEGNYFQGLYQFLFGKDDE